MTHCTICQAVVRHDEDVVCHLEGFCHLDCVAEINRDLDSFDPYPVRNETLESELCLEELV